MHGARRRAPVAGLVRYANNRTPAVPAGYPVAPQSGQWQPGPGQATPAQPQNRSEAGRKGPFVRIDRANEVAAHYQSLGYSTSIAYLGTLDYREYAVDVW